MEKIKKSFGGIIGGIILVIIGTVLLWWNEGNNVKNIKTTNELAKNVINVESSNINSENEGKLISTNGSMVVTDETLTDLEFNASKHTAKLDRVVEVYQWVEESETDDNNNTTYTYKKEWSETLIDSSNYHESNHTNISVKPFESKSYIANEVKVGSFSLSSNQVSSLETTAVLELNSEIVVPENYTISGKYITNSKDINNATVGDVRISFTYNDYKDISVLAVQTGSTFKNYTSKVGKEVNRVESGIFTGEEMIKHLESENNALKWILRVVGAVLIIIGYIVFLNPIAALTSFVPILGSLVNSAISLVGLLVGIIHAIIIIAIAWFRYRPLLSIVLIVLIVLCIVLIKNVLKKGKKVQA